MEKQKHFNRTEKHRELFLAVSDGDLIRRTGPGVETIRKGYSFHHGKIETGREVCACLRAGSSTDLGGYPLYFITSDGAALSFETVYGELTSVIDSVRNQSGDGWQVVAVEVNYEDGELVCAHSGERIQSAYAEDEMTCRYCGRGSLDTDGVCPRCKESN